MDEPYKLPTARTVPDRAAELVRMLDDPKLHPLIKSAATQAWALAIRPFPEGNDSFGIDVLKTLATNMADLLR